MHVNTILVESIKLVLNTNNYKAKLLTSMSNVLVKFFITNKQNKTVKFVLKLAIV